MRREERALLLREELPNGELTEGDLAHGPRARLRLERRRAHVPAGHRVDLHHDVRREAKLVRKAVRVDRTELHDRVARPSLDSPRTSNHADGVQIEVGCVEEEHLPDLCLERIEAEAGDRGSVVGGGNRELQLDAVRLLRELEELDELLVGESLLGHHLSVLAPD